MNRGEINFNPSFTRNLLLGNNFFTFLMNFLFCIIFILIISFASGQAQYSAINSFYSSTSLSLGGAGYLSPNLLSLKNNPSVKNDDRIINVGIINYKRKTTKSPNFVLNINT